VEASTQRFESVELLSLIGAGRPPQRNERCVEDWHVTPDGRICQLNERITSDPSDLGRNYRRDSTGNESEDPGIERRFAKGLMWVKPKPGAKHLPIGTRVIWYA
jgi:hypothetical protein